MKCLTISTQFRGSTFCLTFTLNPYWVHFQALKRGDGLYSDSAVAALPFRLMLNALMKFTCRKNDSELFPRLSGELGIRNAECYTRIFGGGGIKTAAGRLAAKGETESTPPIGDVSVKFPGKESDISHWKTDTMPDTGAPRSRNHPSC
jgi:hypothetical protein